jgi:hypothetical protein
MPRALRPTRRRRRGGSTGQALVIFVLAFTVLVGFTGLSVDVGHAYVAHRQAQDGSDAAALAGGRQMLTATMTTGVPVVPTNGTGTCCSATVTAAHDYAQQNGYPTVLNETCESYAAAAVGNTPAHLDETWFNSGFAGSCTATGGYSTKVELHTPPVFSGGEPTPPDCKLGAPSRYSCIQVVITSLISNYFLSALGFPSQYTVTKATAYAQPSSNTLGTPPATAIYLYEPQSGCAAGHQCFADGAAAPAPSRTNLSCTGGNCPTFWTRQGTKPSIFGYDGSKLSPPLTDTPAVESNGDMVINDDTVFCDPYNQGPTYCSGGPSSPAGAQGYSAPAGSLLFCQAQPGDTYPQLAPTTPNTCSAAPAGAAPPWAGVKHLNGNGTAFTPCNTICSITVNNPNPPSCPGIVLNGESVASHYSAGDPCAPEAGSEYTLEPGVYPYIVINHGQYFFDSGVFEINGTTGGGPTNTTPGNGTANGIDHSGEAPADFDLCTNYSAGNTCPNLKAGVWIGHGKGSFTAATTGTSGTVCAGGGSTGAGTQGGGGDATQVSGSGVLFKLDSSAGGFVVTNEVQSLQLSSPGSNNTFTTPPVPVLIDEENSSFIHLDGQHGAGASANGYNGIIYQTPNATAGGVELNPGTGGNQAATLQGQVLAYSFTTFGTQGIAVDFSGGYGGGSGLSISSSGHSESSIIVTNNNKYSPRAVDNKDGTETFSLDYTDEWALDAYDTYIKINSGSPIFFSSGVWPPCSSSCQTPPQSQSPSDSFPAVHGAVVAPYTQGLGRGAANQLQGAETVAPSDDWIYTFNQGGTQYSFETLGQWTWGHEKDIPNHTTLNPDLAEINLTFPKPSGTSFTLSIFMEDGDHCGDYASAQYTFPVAGGTPGTGTVQAGGVSLEE